MTQVSDLPLKNTTSFSPEMYLKDALYVLTKHDLPGAPVINGDLKVIGSVTQYDLFINESHIYFPTFFQILQEIKLYKNDNSFVKKNINAILSMKVKDIMNSSPIVVRMDTSLEEVAKIFSEYNHLIFLPVVNEYGKLMGTINQHDLIKVYAKDGPKLTFDVIPKRVLDKNVNSFISYFESKYLFVSRLRVRFWILFSLLFVILGFFVATMALINVSF